MKPLNLRLFLFNTIEVLTGSKKNKHYNHVKQQIEQGTHHTPQLNKLLSHACSTTSFYNKFNPKKDLSTFPVINKNTIKAHYAEFQSETYRHTKNKVAATSGSTGTPFKVLQNPDKVIRNSADNLYFSELAGYNMGNKLYYFRMWNAFEKKKRLSRWAYNMVPIDVFDLTDSYLQTLLSNIKKNKIAKSWIGYASAFETLCQYLDKTNASPIECNLQSAIAISESLSPHTKQRLKKYFNVDTVSRYSNVENGIIAQQLPGTSYFKINAASYHVEILELNADNPVENGKKGRIVITDLYNFCMPMIRYDTGDIGIMDIVDGSPVLTQVEGRKIDAVTNTKGEIISNNIMLLLNNYHELNQCQLIQKNTKDYVFKVNIDGVFKNEKKLVNNFKTYLGNDANIKVEYVDEIPLLASGKRRVMVNEMVR